MIPFVMIDLDKPRKLRFGMTETVEFEQLTGIKLVSLNLSDISGVVCARMLHVMLKQEDPDLTFEQSNKLVDDYAPNIPYIVGKVAEAVRAGYAIDGGEKNAKAAKPNS